MFEYILRSFYRGSGNVKMYILTIAALGAILLMILYAPAGYLNEVLEVVPKPDISISDHPPGTEMYYGYLNIGSGDFLVISSRNTSEVLRLLIGKDVRISKISIGCKISNSTVRGYLEDLIKGRVEVLECMDSFIDYAAIVEYDTFQQITGHCPGEIQKIYLRNYAADGIAAPSAYTLARDLLKIVSFHQNLLYASSTILLSAICLILGLRSSNDIKQMLTWLSEMHIPIRKTLFYICLIYLGATIIGVFAGYGLAHLMVPLILIFLKLFFKIPYIYAGLDISSIIVILPIALLSLLSYILAILWMIFRGR